MNDYGFTLEQEANFLAAKQLHESQKRLHIEQALNLAQLRLELGDARYEQLLADEGIEDE